MTGIARIPELDLWPAELAYLEARLPRLEQAIDIARYVGDLDRLAALQLQLTRATARLEMGKTSVMAMECVADRARGTAQT